MNAKQIALIALGTFTFGMILAQTKPAGSDRGQITITPPGSQKVITDAPERFTGSVRVQFLFGEASGPVHWWAGDVSTGCALRLAHSSAWPGPDRDGRNGSGAALGRSGSSHVQRRCDLDSTRD